ncbi:MAG: cysteine hydrolase family protein [Roseiflexaceae bacterium]
MDTTMAVLVIDMQVVLTEGAHEREAVVGQVRDLIGRARDHAVPVIYLQHTADGWPPLQHGAPTWAIDPALAPEAGELVIEKWASDAFTGTPLQAELAARGVKRLVVTGMMTEGCVDSTCRRALSLGYDVVLAADGHTTWDNVLPAAQIIAHHNATLPDLPFPGHTLVVKPAAEIVL